MADLIDRMTFHEDKTGRPKISNHQFSGYMILYALGLATRGEVATAWDLQGDELVQANLIADEVDDILKADDKHRFVDRMDAVAMLLDSRDARYVTGETIDKVKVKADIGIV